MQLVNDERGISDKHGQINGTVNLQPIHTLVFIYIINDLILSSPFIWKCSIVYDVGLSEHDIWCITRKGLFFFNKKLEMSPLQQHNH